VTTVTKINYKREPHRLYAPGAEPAIVDVPGWPS
jgi:hypothetical protein